MTRLVSLLVALPLALALVGCDTDVMSRCRLTLSAARTAHDSLVTVLASDRACDWTYRRDFMRGVGHD